MQENIPEKCGFLTKYLLRICAMHKNASVFFCPAVTIAVILKEGGEKR